MASKNQIETPRQSDIAIFRRLFQEARPFWPHVAGIFLFGFLDGPIGLLAPLPLKIAVDSAIESHPLPGFLARMLPQAIANSPGAILLLAAALMVGIAVLSGVLGLASSFLRSYSGERLTLNFRARVFAHMQRLSLRYHDAKGTADSVYRVQNDTATLQYVCLDGLPPFVTSLFTLVAMFYVTFRIDRELALVALAVSPVMFLLSQKYRPVFRQRSKEVKQLDSAAMGVVTEVLAALRVVKAFGREQHEEHRYVRRSTEGMWARIKLDLIGGVYGLLISLVTAAGTASVLWIGAQHVRAGTLTLGSLLLVISYLGQLYSPLKTIGRKAAALQGHIVSAERAFSVLDEAPDVPERPGAIALNRATGVITLRNLSFAYHEGHPVLNGLSIHIPAGARVGISGKTGAGKTTLLGLLSRLSDPTAGEILLDGRDLRDYRLADLRNQFAVVLQDAVLFSTSIAENIAYARPGASEEDIVRAAQLADAHDFIAGLPQGYQTVVGERGMRLSGGERQRISIARAFLKDAPILLLDEPTSSVDTRTEAGIMRAAERLMQGRTTFMVAHRTSTLEHCDIRLELEHGRLIQTAGASITASSGGRVG